MNSFERELFCLDFLACLLLASCTTVIKPAPRVAQYSSGEKISLKIALNLTDELRAAKWEQRALIGGGIVMAVGTALTEDAPEFARNTFANVVEIKNGNALSKPVDAVLTPKMAFIGMEYGQTMFSEDTLTLKLEWTLADPAGNVLWADTVTGLGKSKSGYGKDLRLAIEDVLKNSQATMLSAQAIQHLVAKKQASPK